MQKISEGSILLQEGKARALDGPTEVGSGAAREEAVPLSQLIDVVNERFGTDFNQADQLFFDQIVEAAMSDDGLRQAAAGTFGDPQHVEDDGFEWVAMESRHRLGKGMFVAQVVGKSMEPAIPDGAWCLFRAPVEGSRQGKTVLAQLRDATDPESGQRYTVKRYESQKAKDGDSWRHAKIIPRPVNADFGPIVLTDAEEGQIQVVAEFLEVLAGFEGSQFDS